MYLSSKVFLLGGGGRLCILGFGWVLVTKLWFWFNRRPALIYIIQDKRKSMHEIEFNSQRTCQGQNIIYMAAVTLCESQEYSSSLHSNCGPFLHSIMFPRWPVFVRFLICSFGIIRTVYFKYVDYMYYLEHENECFIRHKTRGAAERFISDKARIARVLNSLKNYLFYWLILSLCLRKNFQHRCCTSRENRGKSFVKMH